MNFPLKGRRIAGTACLRVSPPHCCARWLLLFTRLSFSISPSLYPLIHPSHSPPINPPSSLPQSVCTYGLMSYFDTFFSTVSSLKFTQGVLTNEPGAPVCPSEVAALTTRERANTRRERIAKHAPRLFGAGRCLKWHTLQIFSTAAHTDATVTLFCVYVRVSVCVCE